MHYVPESLWLLWHTLLMVAALGSSTYSLIWMDAFDKGSFFLLWYAMKSTLWLDIHVHVKTLSIVVVADLMKCKWWAHHAQKGHIYALHASVINFYNIQQFKSWCNDVLHHAEYITADWLWMFLLMSSYICQSSAHTSEFPSRFRWRRPHFHILVCTEKNAFFFQRNEQFRCMVLNFIIYNVH